VKIDTWLAELKIPREAYRLVTLLPLVHVAWADGKIQREERKLILQIAAERGILENGGRETLEHWLTTPPNPAQLKGNITILNELARSRGQMADRVRRRQPADAARVVPGRGRRGGWLAGAGPSAARGRTRRAQVHCHGHSTSTVPRAGTRCVRKAHTN